MSHRVPFDDTPIDATLTTKAFWKQAADRCIKTAIQSFAVFFGVGVGVTAIDWKQAAISVGITTTVTLIMALTSAKLYEVESFWVDVAQRAGRTFLATFVGGIAATANSWSSLAGIDWGNAASLALSATLLSVFTSMGVRNVMGVPDTASMFRGAELVPVVANQITGQVQAVVQANIAGAQQAMNQIAGQASREYERISEQAYSAMDSLQRPPR